MKRRTAILGFGSFFLVMAATFIGLRTVTRAAVTTGTYLSPAIGTNAVVGFKEFVVQEQTLPTDTDITFRFAGSKDNYATWSDVKYTYDKIDLAPMTQLQGSQFMKVEITLASTGTNVPSLGGFQVTYATTQEVQTSVTNTNTNTNTSTSSNTNSTDVTVNTGSGTTSGSSSASSTSSSSSNTTASSTTPPPAASTTAISTSSPSVAPSPTQTTTKTVAFADAQQAATQPATRLVSTGGSLLVNLLLALFLSAITTWWFVLRHVWRPVVTDGQPVPPSIPPTN